MKGVGKLKNFYQISFLVVFTLNMLIDLNFLDSIIMLLISIIILLLLSNLHVFLILKTIFNKELIVNNTILLVLILLLFRYKENIIDFDANHNISFCKVYLYLTWLIMIIVLSIFLKRKISSND